jgi:hypothetical protein
MMKVFAETFARLIIDYVYLNFWVLLSLPYVMNDVSINIDGSRWDISYPCFKMAKELWCQATIIAADMAAHLEHTLFSEFTNINWYINWYFAKEKFIEEVLKF